jgi:hypothetical protein
LALALLCRFDRQGFDFDFPKKCFFIPRGVDACGSPEVERGAALALSSFAFSSFLSFFARARARS